MRRATTVLILVLMEDALREALNQILKADGDAVLILVLMEDALRDKPTYYEHNH